MDRKQFIRFLAGYLKINPEKAWRKYVEFINSQIEVTEHVKKDAWFGIRRKVDCLKHRDRA